MATSGDANVQNENRMGSESKPIPVPKFSSFKAPPPKPTVKSDKVSASKEEKKNRKDDSPERKSSSSHRRHRDESPNRHQDKRRRTVSPAPAPSVLLQSELYKIDSKGDAANITYGTSYRYSVPTFHRFGAGYILGLDGKWRIDRERGEGKGLVVGVRMQDSNNKRKGGNIFAVDTSKVGRLKLVEGVTKGFGPNDEFVPVSGRLEEKSEDVSATGPDYRSIEGKAKASGPEDIEAVLSDDEETFSYSDELQRRTVELDRKLQSHPDDIQTWLDYAALQDELNPGQKASNAEIKMDIFKKALEKNRWNTKLLLELFKLESLLWEPKRVLAHWDEVLEKNQNPEMLIEYLNYRQTALFSFTYPEMVSTYARCFSILRNLIWNAKDKEKPELERTMLYTFQRFAHFAKEAGYDELAIASFQALVELNLFRQASKIPTYEKERDTELDRFEEFWDSECLRFGEVGAKGWHASDPDNMPDIPPIKEDEIYAQTIEDWYRHEEKTRGSMPARTTDDLPDNDPYRVILFNDLRPFLYTFQTDIVRRIPYAFLAFCGVNLPSPDLSSNDSSVRDPWLNNVLDTAEFWPSSSNPEMIEWINGEAVEPERLPAMEGPFTFKRKVWSVDLDTLFPPTDTWFQRLEEIDLQFVTKPFLSTGLTQLKPVIQDEWFMIYHLAIENLLSPSTVLKLAKSYIKGRKTSVSLWNIYALLLWRRNEFEEARKIWKTAIEMTFSTHSNPIILWRTWISAEFELDSSTARVLFLELASEKPDFKRSQSTVGGAGEMKSRKWIQEQFDRALSFKELGVIEHVIFLGILLEYFTGGLDGVVRKCRDFIGSLRERELFGSVTHERILMGVSRVLYHHTRVQGWYRLSTLREFWEEAISTFPSNTAFLSLFVWNEANARIDGRVRKLLVSLEKTASIDTWVFAIWAEITVERGRVSEFGVRALFERAVESMNMSVLIWVLYIEFEARYGRLDRVKELVFRAIRECPWSKDLPMLAFGVLRELFERKDLARVYNVLVEKEIRIHGELEGLEEDTSRKAIQLPYDESSDEEE